MTWLQPSIGQVCLPTTQRDPSRDGDGIFRYVDIAGIDRETKSISRADPIPCADAPSRARKEIQRGDVLVSTVRPNLNAVAQVPEELDGAIASTGFSVLRANPKLVDSRYLFYRVQQPEFVQFLSAHAKGANYPAVTDGIVRRAALPLPPISEQRRIVELLDEADRLRKLRREAHVKAMRILPALFIKMVGDPATNPKGWPLKSLGQLSDDRPEYGANASAIPFEEGKPRYIRITDISEDGTLSDKEVVTLDAADWGRYILAEGDVLFARSGNTVGKTYIYRHEDGQCAFAGYLIRFRFASGKVNPWFVFGLTQTSYYRAWVEAHKRVAGQPNINGQEYAGLRLPLPPASLQKEFARTSRSVGELLSRSINAGGRVEDLFSTLVQLAFCGEITAKWRVAHMKELLAEMQQQAKALNLALPSGERLMEA